MSKPRPSTRPDRRTLARREFLALAAISPLASSLWQPAARASTIPASRILFTSQGKSAVMHADGSGLRYFDFKVPGQATWQPGPIFSDGRVMFLSMEPRRDGPGKPFEEYYTQTPTHLWVHDPASGALDEICTKDRAAPFVTPALLVGDDRLLVQVVKGKVGQIISMRLDGSDPRPFTQAGEGLPYGLSLSPDRRRVAFHLASPQGYQVWTSDVDGTNRTKLAADSAHLYFGTHWSPDGQWVVYVDCHYQQDPAHDWADVCVGRADGGAHRVLTSGQTMWFGATYGSPKTRGGGSNVPSWTPDGAILFPERTAGAKVPWEHQPNRPDVDHFNRDFKPERAKGATRIARLNPNDGKVTPLTAWSEGTWDFRSSASSDGEQIVFCRARTGEPPAIWTMSADGGNQRMLTAGIDELGADHPRWLK
jgi:Tol biopolymer transport system component